MEEKKSDNILLIIAIIAVIVSAIGAGIAYNYISALKEDVLLAPSGIVNLTVEALAAINFSYDEINFHNGTVTVGSQNCTMYTGKGGITLCGADGSWDPVGEWGEPSEQGFVVENIGNVNLTVDLKSGKDAATYIGGSFPRYEWNVSENETGSCDDGGFYTDFNLFDAVNTSGDGTKVCDNFVYEVNTGDPNELRIDILVAVPQNSFTGELIDTITMTVAEKF